MRAGREEPVKIDKMLVSDKLRRQANCVARRLAALAVSMIAPFSRARGDRRDAGFDVTVDPEQRI